MLRCFTTPCSMSSWYSWTAVWPLCCKNEDVSAPDGTPPTKQWHRKGDDLPAPSECTSRDVWVEILLYRLLYCSSMVKIFSSVKRTFSCLFLACHWRRRFTLVYLISFKAGVRRCPFEWRCAVMCGSSLMRHDLIGSICSAFGTWSSVSRADFGESAPVLFWWHLQPSHLSGILTKPCLQPSRVKCRIDEHSRNFQWFQVFENLRMGFSQLGRAVTATWFSLKPHSMLML